MDDQDSLRNQITNNMQLKTTEELLLILKQNDREEWSDTAFEVVRNILIERTGEAPKIPIQSDGLSEESNNWESINWKNIYRSTQRQSIQNKIGFIIVSFISILFFILNETDLTIKFVFGLFFMGILGWNLWLVISEQKASRLMLEARVYLKQEAAYPFGNRNSNWVEIVIQRAFKVTPDGQVLSVKDWNGHHKVHLSNELYDSIQEQDEVKLFCLSNGRVLCKIEEYTNS